MVIRVHHSSRLVTINIDGQSLCSSTGSLFKDGSINSSSSFIWQTQADLGNFVSSLARKLGTDKYNSLPSVTRGLEMTPYWTTTGDIGNFWQETSNIFHRWQDYWVPNTKYSSWWNFTLSENTNSRYYWLWKVSCPEHHHWYNLMLLQGVTSGWPDTVGWVRRHLHQVSDVRCWLHWSWHPDTWRWWRGLAGSVAHQQPQDGHHGGAGRGRHEGGEGVHAQRHGGRPGQAWGGALQDHNWWVIIATIRNNTKSL